MSKRRSSSTGRPLRSNTDFGLVIFTEGATEEVFYRKLIAHLRTQKEDTGPAAVRRICYRNLGGVGLFGTKPARILEKQIRPRYPGVDFVAVCAYDTDVFEEYKPKPPVDWREARKTLQASGAKRVVEIRARKSIEDWFLSDLPGVCQYLGIDPNAKLVGATGLERMKHLFGRGNRVYVKGEEAADFVSCLDMGRIFTAHSAELGVLRELLSLD